MNEELPRVVIADDDPIYRRQMEKQIGRWGYQTVIAKDGFEAQQLALSDPNTTLAVFDWMMPSMDGLEACRQIRRHRSDSDMYILIVSGAHPTDGLDEIRNAGANDLVSKVSNPNELKSRLDEAHRRQVARRAELRTILESAAINHQPSVAQIEPSSFVRAPKFQRAWLGRLSLPESTIVPEFDVESLQFRESVSRVQIDSAAQRGELTAELLDSVLVCPQCESLPTFRRGCSCCGSGRIEQELMIHHFACAHVGRAVDFESERGLACPKCRVRDLTVGADLEYQRGPLQCIDCRWMIEELTTIGHCLACGFRFPAEQALVKELVAYHARRLEIVGLIPSAR